MTPNMIRPILLPLFQLIAGVLTVFGITLPEGALDTIRDNLELTLGGIIVLTAFVPSILQGRKSKKE